MSIETEFYDILEIKYTATMDEIKKAYRRKALIHHPDKGGKEEDFKKISIAYETLVNPEKRDLYDYISIRLGTFVRSDTKRLGRLYCRKRYGEGLKAGQSDPLRLL